VADLERLTDALDGALGDTLALLLTRRELGRTKQRVARRLREAAYPLPGDGWPSLPWPAF
jgi:hypothetical protein